MRLLRNYKHPQLQANWGRKVSVCFHQTHDRGLIMWWQAVSCAEFSQADPLLWSPLFSPGEVNSSSRDPCPWSSGHTQNDKSCFFRNFWMSSRARSIKLLSFHRMNKSLSLQPNPHWECFTSVLFPLHPIHMKRPVTGANGGEVLTCPPIYSPQRAGNPTGGYWATLKSVPSLGGHVCIQSPSVQFSSVAQSCLTLCDAMDGSTPGFPVHHQLLELAQTHIHQVSDTIQPSHPQSSPSPAVNLSQHQGLFQWVSSLYRVAKILELQLHHQSFQWIFTTDFLWDWLAWSPCSPRDSQESSPVPEFEGISSSVLRVFYCPSLTLLHDYWKNHSFDYTGLWR